MQINEDIIHYTTYNIDSLKLTCNMVIGKTCLFLYEINEVQHYPILEVSVTSQRILLLR